MAWYHRIRRNAVPPARGNIGRHNLEIEDNSRGKAKRVFVDGERYVKDKIHFSDLSRGQQATLAGAYAVNTGVTGATAYGLHNLGQVVDSGFEFLGGVYNAGQAFLGKVFTGSEQTANRNLEVLLQSGKLNSEYRQTAETYLTNFTGYRAASAIFDQARASLDKAISEAAAAAEKITPHLPTDSIQSRITDWINKNVRGINVDDPNYAKSNRPVINLRKDIYDTLQDASNNVTNEMDKPNPNLTYSFEQMGRFNNAYSTLIKEEEAIRVGVEKANPTELRTMQEQIDQIKPLVGFNPHMNIILPVLGGIVVYSIINRRVVKPIKMMLYQR